MGGLSVQIAEQLFQRTPSIQCRRANFPWCLRAFLFVSSEPASRSLSASSSLTITLLEADFCLFFSLLLISLPTTKSRSRWVNHGLCLPPCCPVSTLPCLIYPSRLSQHRNSLRLSDAVANRPGTRRQELVQWLNSLLQLNITKVEQCGTG